MSTDDDLRTAALASVEAWVAGQVELEFTRAGDEGWLTTLRGEHKRTIGCYLSVGDRTMIIESHFMRAPDENAAALYDLLLKRNQRTYVLRFCTYDSGDLMIVGVLPLTAVSPGEVDRLVGTLLTVADETYNAALRLGFAGYIEREQAWRESVGLARNPIT